MSFIAQRLEHFDSSDFRNAMQNRLLLTDPIDLSIGVPEELTPEHIKASGIRAIQEDRTTYMPANGLFDLRLALARKLEAENHVPATADSVTIVPGLTTGQLLVYLAVLNPDDEVIVFDPYYPPYAHLASMVGAKVVLIETAPTFQPDPAVVAAHITDKTKLIVINTPNNPSGAVYPEKTLRELAALAEKHNVLLISDEIYEHFTYETKHFSVGSIYPNTLTMNGFSKEYAMTGWRVGYINGPQTIIDAINELQQYVVMSSSSISQHAALGALHQKPQKLAEKYRKKRDLVLHSLRKSGYELAGAQGAYYAFFKAPKDMTDIEFIQLAASHGLILVPGRAFSKLHGYVRLSYGANMQTLQAGLAVLDNIAKSLR